MLKASSRLREVFRFVITGGFCFVIEFGVLVALRELLFMDTLLATPIAFTVSVIVNYLLCVRWVFVGARDSGRAATVGFIVTSVIGLFLNEGLMFLFRMLLGEDTLLFSLSGLPVTMYMLNKTLATLLVMIWNFLTKKAILQSRFLRRFH